VLEDYLDWVESLLQDHCAIGVCVEWPSLHTCSRRGGSFRNVARVLLRTKNLSYSSEP
jgi:hypothetical protein